MPFEGLTDISQCEVEMNVLPHGRQARKFTHYEGENKELKRRVTLITKSYPLKASNDQG